AGLIVALQYSDSSSWSGGKSLSQLYTFEQYEVVKRKRISSTSTLLTIQPTTFGPRAKQSRLDSQRVAEASENGIWSVQVKHPLLTIARLYTPIPPTLTEPSRPAWKDKSGKIPADPEEDQLRFLVRSYPDGELSKYLSRLQPGAHVEIRGPYQEYKIPDGVSDVLFLAGGTGIAPALQMATSLLDKAKGEKQPNMSILWANRHAKDCQGGVLAPPPPLENMFARLWSATLGAGPKRPMTSGSRSRDESPIVEELANLKRQHSDSFEIHYFADDEGRFITRQDVQSKLRYHNSPSKHGTQADGVGKRLILISGPDGFVEYLAGPKEWKGGKEVQGSLGGMLKDLNPQGWNIWKL
ncbi:MAG: hypothetical protein Q9174_004954, partial [Haloplaca sp. 1 TL-2023]